MVKALVAAAVLLAGCDTSLNGFRFSCGPDAGCPTGQSCQGGICAAPGGTGGTGASGGSSGAGGSTVGATGGATGTSGGGGSTGSAGTNGGGTSGASSAGSGGWQGGGTTGCTLQGSYQTLPSLGSATPYAIALDGLGHVLVLVLVGENQPELLSLSPDGGSNLVTSAFDGNGVQFGVPAALAVDPQHNVFLLDDSGDIFELAGDGGTPTPLCTHSCVPGQATAMALGPADTLFLTYSSCVMSWAGGVTSTVAGNCQTPGADSDPTSIATAAFESLKGIAVDSTGTRLVVADGSESTSSCLRLLDLDAGLVSDYGAPCAKQPFYTTAAAGRPFGLAEDLFGNVFATDIGPEDSVGDIWEVTPSGTFVWIAGGGSSSQPSGSACGVGFGYPAQIAVDASDDLFVLDQQDGNPRVVELLP